MRNGFAVLTITLLYLMLTAAGEVSQGCTGAVREKNGSPLNGLGTADGTCLLELVPIGLQSQDVELHATERSVVSDARGFLIQVGERTQARPNGFRERIPACR